MKKLIICQCLSLKTRKQISFVICYILFSKRVSIHHMFNVNAVVKNGIRLYNTVLYSPPNSLSTWYRYLYDLIYPLQWPARNWFQTQKSVGRCKQLHQPLSCISKIEFVLFVSMGKRWQKIVQP